MGRWTIHCREKMGTAVGLVYATRMWGECDSQRSKYQSETRAIQPGSHEVSTLSRPLSLSTGCHVRLRMGRVTGLASHVILRKNARSIPADRRDLCLSRSIGLVWPP